MSSPRRHTHTQPHRKTGLCSRLAAHTPPLPQVAFADRILLNKTDLVSEEDLLRVEKRLKSINSQESARRETRAEREGETRTHTSSGRLPRAPPAPPRSRGGRHTPCRPAGARPALHQGGGVARLGPRHRRLRPEARHRDGPRVPQHRRRDAAPRCSPEMRTRDACGVSSRGEQAPPRWSSG